jgi:hypothetical protein
MKATKKNLYRVSPSQAQRMQLQSADGRKNRNITKWTKRRKRENNRKVKNKGKKQKERGSLERENF